MDKLQRQPITPYSREYAAALRRDEQRKEKRRKSCKHEQVVIICLRCKSHLEKIEKSDTPPLLSIDIPHND